MAALDPNHPLAAHKKVRMTDFADTRLIRYPNHKNAQFRRSMQSLYHDAGVTLLVAHAARESMRAPATRERNGGRGARMCLFPRGAWSAFRRSGAVPQPE